MRSPEPAEGPTIPETLSSVGSPVAPPRLSGRSENQELVLYFRNAGRILIPIRLFDFVNPDALALDVEA